MSAGHLTDCSFTSLPAQSTSVKFSNTPPYTSCLYPPGHRNDMLVVLILNLYRHGMALALKDEIREAAARLRADGVTDLDLTPEAVDERLARTHSIGELVDELNLDFGRLRLGPDNQLPDDALKVLNSLQLLDKTGQALRYSTVKSGDKRTRSWCGPGPRRGSSICPGPPRHCMTLAHSSSTGSPVSSVRTRSTRRTCGKRLTRANR
jgi:hypothetical protein